MVLKLFFTGELVKELKKKQILEPHPTKMENTNIRILYSQKSLQVVWYRFRNHGLSGTTPRTCERGHAVQSLTVRCALEINRS